MAGESRGRRGEKAHLCGADLRGAALCGANLRNVNLRNANLYGANLCGAALCWADLRETDMREVDLRGANLDFSAWPLQCSSTMVKADDRLFSQLLFHATRLDVSGCSGGVKEAVQFLRQMAVCNIFPEYREDTAKCPEFEI